MMSDCKETSGQLRNEAVKALAALPAMSGRIDVDAELLAAAEENRKLQELARLLDENATLRLSLRGSVGEAEIVDRAVRAVCSEWRTDRRSLLSRARHEPLVTARQTAMWLVRRSAGLPLKRIGELFGGFDHGTVMCAIEKVETLSLKTSERLRFARLLEQTAVKKENA